MVSIYVMLRLSKSGVFPVVKIVKIRKDGGAVVTDEEREKILGCVIGYFSENVGTVPKILVQKAIYFLNFIGIDTGFRFDGQQYGPFSTDIVNIADKMEISRKIKINGATYIAKKDLADNCLEVDGLSEKLRIYFEELLEKDDSFDTVDRVGTVMFVMKNRESGDVNGIMGDVEKWKPGKYSNDEIMATIRAIEETREMLD